MPRSIGDTIILFFVLLVSFLVIFISILAITHIITFLTKIFILGWFDFEK